MAYLQQLNDELKLELKEKFQSHVQSNPNNKTLQSVLKKLESTGVTIHYNTNKEEVHD